MSDSEFRKKLARAGNDRQLLIALMAEIDAEKRSVRSALSKLSSEPDQQFAKGKERQVLIRRMKDKISFLTEDRETVRRRLADARRAPTLNPKSSVTQGAKHGAGFADAFLRAAQEYLSEEQFLEIEIKAGNYYDHHR